MEEVKLIAPVSLFPFRQCISTDVVSDVKLRDKIRSTLLPCVLTVVIIKHWNVVMLDRRTSNFTRQYTHVHQTIMVKYATTKTWYYN